MSQTFKDRKDYPKYRRAKNDLSEVRIRAKRYGFEPEVEECPICCEPLKREDGVLCCHACEWSEAQEILMPEAA